MFVAARNAYGDIVRIPSYQGPSIFFDVRNLTPYHNETVEVQACYERHLCLHRLSITARTGVSGESSPPLNLHSILTQRINETFMIFFAAPHAVSKLVGAVVNQTSPFFCWEPPMVPNGPIDGYHVALRRNTDSSLVLNKILPATQTRFEYPTHEELRM